MRNGTLPLPFQLGSAYILDRLLGSGTTGNVYHGTHIPTGTPVAAKILHAHHATNPDILARFVQEKQILTTLEHPNITRVFDMIVENETLAIITEYIDGLTLTQLLAQHGTLPPHLATELIIQLCEALDIIHSQRIIHRDIKTDNVLLTHNWVHNTTDCLRLTDFSVATIFTGTGEITGTPAYMAPEIFTHKTPTTAVDIYAAGITYYQLLAGVPPFIAAADDPDPLTTFASLHTSAGVPPLELPEELNELLACMLAKHPHRRPTASKILGELRSILPTLEKLPPLPIQRTTSHETVAGAPTIIAKSGATIIDSDVRSTQNPDATPAPPLLPDTPATVQSTIIEQDTRSTPSILEIFNENPKDTSVRILKKKPLIIAGAALAIIAVVAGIFFYMKYAGNKTLDAPLQATADSEQFPSGLTSHYEAQWNPETKIVTLTITYTSHKANLSGSFLETLPPRTATEHTCPSPATWTNNTTRENITAVANNPALTNIDTPCTWEIILSTITPDTPVTIQTTIPMTFTENDIKTDPNPLQTWLNTAIETNSATLTNPNIHSAAYPVQRIQGIEVTVNPQHYPTNTNIDITINPVWPSGTDTNPLFRSPRTGPYTSTLTAIAGNINPVHLYDECGGAISITRDGETATTQYPADNCHITVTIGNFDHQPSNTITITGHDS